MGPRKVLSSGRSPADGERPRSVSTPPGAESYVNRSLERTCLTQQNLCSKAEWTQGAQVVLVGGLH